jgi:serine/threonine kinase 19
MLRRMLEKSSNLFGKEQIVGKEGAPIRLSLINRLKYKEMVLANLEKRRLWLTPLDICFHIKDHIGSGLLKAIQSPIGMLICLSRD